MSGEADRRRSQRLERVEDHRIVATILRPGHRARLIDASATGLLIETSQRLLPGTNVELHVQTPTRRSSVRGRVLRCAVTRLRSSFVCYRSAIHLDGHLSWLADEDEHAALDHEHRSGRHTRVAATPHVVGYESRII